jgi:hypothetical protein
MDSEEERMAARAMAMEGEGEDEEGVRRWDQLDESEQTEICQKVDLIIAGSKLPLSQKVKGEYICMLSQGTVKFQCNLTIEGEVKANQAVLVQDVMEAID